MEDIKEELLKDNNTTDEHESQLNKPITYKFVIGFTIPTIISFLLMNIFGTIDSVFAARGIDEMALSAIKFVMPAFTIAIAIAAMLSMGGCALVAKKKATTSMDEVRQNFTLLTLTTFVASTVIAIVSWILREQIVRWLGANDNYVFYMALEYFEPLILIMPLLFVGMFLIQFLIAEGKPVLGMITSVSGAIVSTTLNIIFIFVLELGLFGLALATGIGYAVPAIIGITYFTLNKKGTLYFTKPKWDFNVIKRSSINGVSEMITMVSISVTSIVMNNVLMNMDNVGWQGVAASGIVVAIQGIFASLFIGYSAGIAPVVSYNYGKKKDNPELPNDNLKKLFKKSLVIIASLSLLALMLALVFANLLVSIYVDAGPCLYTGVDIHAMTVRGLRIVSLGFILMGFNAFATGWFTAYNDGLISGILSVVRTFIFTLTSLISFAYFFGLDGVWLALPMAEVFTIALTVIFLYKLGKKYHYHDR